MIIKPDRRGWTAGQWVTPCVICGQPAILRSPRGRPSHWTLCRDVGQRAPRTRSPTTGHIPAIRKMAPAAGRSGSGHEGLTPVVDTNEPGLCRIPVGRRRELAEARDGAGHPARILQAGGHLCRW